MSATTLELNVRRVPRLRGISKFLPAILRAVSHSARVGDSRAFLDGAQVQRTILSGGRRGRGDANQQEEGQRRELHRYSERSRRMFDLMGLNVMFSDLYTSSLEMGIRGMISSTIYRKHARA